MKLYLLQKVSNSCILVKSTNNSLLKKHSFKTLYLALNVVKFSKYEQVNHIFVLNMESNIKSIGPK